MYQTLSSPISTGTFALDRFAAEVLVDGVVAGQHLAEPLRPDGQHDRQPDGRGQRVPAAHPVPEAEDVLRVDAEVGDPAGSWWDRTKCRATADVVGRPSPARASRACVGVGQGLQRGESLGRPR